jgi:hypothetical protein
LAHFSNTNLKKRADDEDSILRKVHVPKDHPKHIAPSIALKPIPKTSDLVQQSLYRFIPRPPDPEEQIDDDNVGME